MIVCKAAAITRRESGGHHDALPENSWPRLVGWKMRSCEQVRDNPLRNEFNCYSSHVTCVEELFTRITS